VVITATDVTEIRRSEQRLQVLNRVLRHDLKNDTNVIGGYANLLRNHVDEEGDDYLDIIDRKVETLTHLSDQAREIDVALHRDGARAEIDLSELVTRLCESLESSFPRATVTVSTPGAAVVCADELLESAVRNVLENAVVHNDGDQPIVEVAVDPDGEGTASPSRTTAPGSPRSSGACSRRPARRRSNTRAGWGSGSSTGSSPSPAANWRSHARADGNADHDVASDGKRRGGEG